MAVIHSARGLGQILRGRRREMGRTQAEVAAAAGVSRAWLAQAEAGKATAAVGLVMRVLDTLDLDLATSIRGAAPARPERGCDHVDLDAIIEDHRR